MKSIEIIKKLSVPSSYLEHNLGITIYDYVRKTRPEKVIELGTLHGYSAICIGLALRDNGFGSLVCYDLWEDYEFNSTTIESTRETIEEYGLSSIVKLEKGDAYTVCKEINYFDLAHIDISNDGERLDIILSLLTKHINNGAEILFEGGTIERDEKSWIRKNNKKTINSVKKKFDYYVWDSRWPGISLISKNREKIPRLLELENFKTSEGTLFPIYKNWEDKSKDYDPKMVYATTVGPSIEKGPILHERRRGYMTAIKGIVDVQCLVDGKVITYSLLNESGQQNVLMIPEGIQNKIINNSNTEAIIINLPDRSWYPFDEDTKKYLDWKWED
jgi:predicted O-methyltransferase YrrM